MISQRPRERRGDEGVGGRSDARAGGRGDRPASEDAEGHRGDSRSAVRASVSGAPAQIKAPNSRLLTRGAGKGTRRVFSEFLTTRYASSYVTASLQLLRTNASRERARHRNRVVDLTIRGGRSGGTGRPAPAIAAPTNGLGGFLPPPPPPPPRRRPRTSTVGAAAAARRTRSRARSSRPPAPPRSRAPSRPPPARSRDEDDRVDDRVSREGNFSARGGASRTRTPPRRRSPRR